MPLFFSSTQNWSFIFIVVLAASQSLSSSLFCLLKFRPLYWVGLGDSKELCRVTCQPLPFCLPTAALEDKEDEGVLMIEDINNHTDLTDNEPVTYEVQKQFMR